MAETNWRIAELAHYANEIEWLTADEASCAYALVRLYDAKTRYGLNSSTVTEIEQIVFGDDVSAANKWLKARVSAAEQLVVVFDETSCFSCGADFFLNAWPDVLRPSRDDAIIYSTASPLILFFCHENEIEVGQRIVYG